MALTNKQRVFVEEYLRCWNATEAARRAGYSENTAAVIGSENLKKPNIAAVIQARIDELAMSANEVLLRLADHARGSMGEFIDPASLTVDLTQAAHNKKLHLIKKIKYISRIESGSDGKEDIETNTVEFELYDAQAALVQLGRYHRLFTDKSEMDFPNGIRITGFEGFSDAELDQIAKE